MAKVFDFSLSEKQLIDFAIEKRKNGDAIGAARYARNAIKTNPRGATAYGVLARLYCDSNELEISNKTIFKGMHESHDYDNLRFRRQLSINYLNLEMPDVASYYSTEQDSDVLDALDIALSEFEAAEREPELHLSYPPNPEYTDSRIAEAFRVAHEGDFATAHQILDAIPDDGSDSVSKAKLMLYTMSNDVDSVIEYGERALREGRDSVPVRCTLSSAYTFKGRKDEAYETLRPIIEKKDSDLETALLILPAVVSLEMHAEIVSIIRRILDRTEFKGSKRLLIWYAQALYNIGQKDIARSVMADAKDFFGEESPAFFYLETFAKNPDKVEYNFILPKEAHIRNMAYMKEILLSSDEELEKFDKTHNSIGDNLEYFVQWAFTTGPKKMHQAIISRLVFYKRGKEIFENSLVSGELDYGLMSSIIDSLEFLNDGVKPLSFDIVSQERFKHIEFSLPRALLSLPSVFQSAVRMSIADVIFTDEEPNFYLERLTKIVNGIADLNADGKVQYSNKSREKLSFVRSADTLVGVLLSKVYEEDESRESVLERYDLNPKLFDKYYDMVFGEGNND